MDAGTRSQDPVSPLVTDPREARARPRPLRFLAMLAQLWLLLAVFKPFRLESPAFLLLSTLLTGAFAIHYWLPFRLKERFWIAFSLAGAYVLLPPIAATALLAAGFGIFALLRLPIPLRARLAVLGV